jgi:hypothetical protein
MFHELTDQEASRRRRTRIIIACVIIAVLAAGCLAFGAYKAYAREQGAAALKESVLESAKQCCAMEGGYPSSLDYLEQHYGLVINHDDYIVSYECFADNIIPSVVVTPR